MITKYLIVFLISMVPLIELRGAIPYAVAFHIPTLPAYLIAVIGKGHETYRDREGVKTPFLERELLEEYAQQIGLE